MPTIGFIGAGNMAEAIARGLLRQAVYQPADIRATDPAPERRRLFNDDLGITCSDQCAQAAGNADIIVLAVKPLIMAEALAQIAPSLKPGALILSIAAGISSRFIEDTLAGSPAGGGASGGGGAGVRVVRIMPNTPMLVGKGMSAVSPGRFATEHDVIAAERIFSAAGKTVRVPESLLDAVTAVSGSGPAYVFYLVETLAAAGAATGLSDQQAGQLARETVIGAAELLAQSKDSPQELRRKVTTPKGTTQAAIETMQAGDFAGLMARAVAAAAQRAKELGK